MTSPQILSLVHGGASRCSLALDDASVEVGSDPSCDLTVHDDRVPPRALLVHPAGGSVYVYDLAAAPGLGARSVLPFDCPLAVGAGFAICRQRASSSDRVADPEPATERIPRSDSDGQVRALMSGCAGSARIFRVGDWPISIGAAPGNRISLDDRALSRHHCRLEPSRLGLAVRDLGSTNGTWVDGVRVTRHLLRPGAVLRVGRTELRAVGRVVPGRRGGLVAEAPSMLSLLSDVHRLARLSWPVLVWGETGVGKEHVARALHDLGRRSGGPFVPINAGGLPRELVESELFGHERGAFTGASRAHRGAFEQAHGGTLFLDEVAELPLDLQTRLLRVLETWRVRRVGGEAHREVDVRLVCATHRDLRREVEEGRFREDLFYRVHRFVLEVPPLRRRPDDVGALATHFLSHIEREVGHRTLTDGALGRLRAHPWPGNVRELRNVLEVAAASSAEPVLDADAVDLAIRRIADPIASAPSTQRLQETLAHYGGNVSAAARALGMPRSTLRDRLRSASDR